MPHGAKKGELQIVFKQRRHEYDDAPVALVRKHFDHVDEVIAENKRLKRELARSQEETEILKKAAA